MKAWYEAQVLLACHINAHTAERDTRRVVSSGPQCISRSAPSGVLPICGAAACEVAHHVQAPTCSVRRASRLLLVVSVDQLRHFLQNSFRV